MSNHLAIAAVTATLKRTLQATLNVDIPGSSVSMNRPQPVTDNADQSVNIYLYQITPNASLRGIDLPTRRDGQAVARPTVALTLHYLFSFYGNETTLEPQAVLGSVVRALHSRPVLTADIIAATLEDPTFAFVSGSDLGLTPEPVRFTPTGLTFEEFSKLWSVLFQIPYVLSVTYEASVVLLDDPVPTRFVPPVRTTRLSVNVGPRPSLTAILSRAADPDLFTAGRQIVVGDTLLLRGRSLQSDATAILIGDVTLAPASVAPDAVTVKLPPSLRAGAQPVAVSISVGSSAPDLVTSDPLAFLLRPVIVTSTVAAAVAAVEVTPAVGGKQRVQLLLKETPSPATGDPRSFTLDRAPPLLGDSDPATTLSFPLGGVAAGTYLAAVRVDGADSPLTFDATAGMFSGPTVTIP